MAMKDLLYRLQPAQMYMVLALSIVYFLVQLFLSHTTHALTLLVDSYHMLCNIVALSGCIMTIKVQPIRIKLGIPGAQSHLYLVFTTIYSIATTTVRALKCPKQQLAKLPTRANSLN